MRTERGARPARGPWTYGWWALVGALLGFGVIAVLTIGPAFLLLGAVLAGIGLVRPSLRNRSAFAAVPGLAVAPLVLAWVNRGGPGRVCSTEGTTVSCTDALSPWPFVALAVGFVVAGVLLARRG